MSRTLLVLALVALLFAGVVMADDSSSSSSGDMSTGSSSVDMSSTGPSSSTVAPTGASSSSTGPSGTSTGSSAGSSTAPSSSTVAPTGAAGNSSSSSTGSSPVVSSTGTAAANVSLTVGLTTDSVFNTTLQNTLAPLIASGLGIQYSGAPTWTSSSNRRRLLTVTNTVTFPNVPAAQADTVTAALANPTSAAAIALVANINSKLAGTGVNVQGATATTGGGNNGGAASALAASPLVLAAAAVFAMLF